MEGIPVGSLLGLRVDGVSVGGPEGASVGLWLGTLEGSGAVGFWVVVLEGCVLGFIEGALLGLLLGIHMEGESVVETDVEWTDGSSVEGLELGLSLGEWDIEECVGPRVGDEVANMKSKVIWPFSPITPFRTGAAPIVTTSECVLVLVAGIYAPFPGSSPMIEYGKLVSA